MCMLNYNQNKTNIPILIFICLLVHNVNKHGIQQSVAHPALFFFSMPPLLPFKKIWIGTSSEDKKPVNHLCRDLVNASVDHVFRDFPSPVFPHILGYHHPINEYSYIIHHTDHYDHLQAFDNTRPIP